MRRRRHDPPARRGPHRNRGSLGGRRRAESQRPEPALRLDRRSRGVGERPRRVALRGQQGNGDRDQQGHRGRDERVRQLPDLIGGRLRRRRVPTRRAPGHTASPAAMPLTQPGVLVRFQYIPRVSGPKRPTIITVHDSTISVYTLWNQSATASASPQKMTTPTRTAASTSFGFRSGARFRTMFCPNTLAGASRPLSGGTHERREERPQEEGQSGRRQVLHGQTRHDLLRVLEPGHPAPNRSSRAPPGSGRPPGRANPRSTRTTARPVRSWN